MSATALRAVAPSARFNRRHSDFGTLVEAMDYAASSPGALSFHGARGDLVKQLSYAEMRDEAANFGARLVHAGLKPGDRLALIAETTADFVIAFVGSQYAGVLPVPLPLPTSFGGRAGYITQLRNQLQSCRARMVLGSEGMDDMLQEAAEPLDEIHVISTYGQFAQAEAAIRLPGLPKSDELSYLQ